MNFLKKNKTAVKRSNTHSSLIGFAFGVFLVLGIFIYSLYSFAAWNNPAATPPNGNVPAPINTGTSTQIKLGTFKLGTTTAPVSSANFYVYKGGLSVNTTTAISNIISVDNLTGTAIVAGEGIVSGVGIPVDYNDAVPLGFADTRYQLAMNNYWTASSTGIFNNNAGNVGIGTWGPKKKLDVRGDTVVYSSNGSYSEGENLFYTGAAATGGGFNLHLGSAGTPPGANTLKAYMRLRNGGNNNVIFGNYYGGSDHIYLEASNANNSVYLVQAAGSVGVGNTSPQTKFDVTLANQSLANIQTTLGANPIGISTTYGAGVVYGPGLVWYTTDNNATKPKAGIWNYMDTNGSKIQFGTSNNYATGITNTAMTIDQAANVGIGQTAPGAKLDVEDTAATPQAYPVLYLSRPNNLTAPSPTTAGLFIKDHASNYPLSVQSQVGTQLLLLRGTGFLGVNSPNPNVSLRVGGNGTAGAQIWANAANTLQGFASFDTGNNYFILGASTTNSSLQFYAGNSARMIIGGANGNVGIATNTPANYKLDVNGDGRFNGNVKVTGNITAGSGDVAEEFYTDKIYPAGTVLVMGDDGYKSSRACNKKYDQTVIGVVSEQPGMIIGQVDGKFKAPVALTGVVKVLVNATGGQIHQGDLLTTSAITGQAMKATNPKVGTVIGKALEDNTGKGYVMAIVNLK